ncbi:ABC-type polysaccharide/polyol phosphate transport system, ATPase component [Bellilinea caldifistulae]|uniref:ABC transporter ATP-binding protein n=1 Tax=Bellilinea caldifistulae TaxID=360411 RepID=UPI0009E1C1BF|nr:ABC transporter ATP-binding protein [Bellilinea caldifistulae]GAP10767.1 ABC-type polysaccharide/polyol phosphate transport system, ATPase component [Bellilinea caldifistulae]
MTKPIIRIDKVSKKFCRSMRRSLYYGLLDMGSELIGRERNYLNLRKDEFWAVKDISFEVQPGETVGLIGHNGAGKTSLLRMLGGLILPDTGKININGRVQALIALGAGFNPVLTGRENIYINASLMGFSKKEINKRFDEIVSFSGLSEFLDMPVQSYSSGMVVRLGFSVAAFLEPDVLLIDEVLSVGDLAFRTKCQVRIQELKNKGVSIIIVSHNLHTISHLCPRSIALEKGKVIYDGDTESAIDIYRLSLLKTYEQYNDFIRGGTGEITIQELEILNENEEKQTIFDVGDKVKIRLYYHTNTLVKNPVFNVVIHILNSHQVTGIRTDVDGIPTGDFEGDGYVDIEFQKFNLLPNAYTFDAVIFHSDGYTFYDRKNNANHLVVRGGNEINGIAYLDHSWKIN